MSTESTALKSVLYELNMSNRCLMRAIAGMPGTDRCSEGLKGLSLVRECLIDWHDVIEKECDREDDQPDPAE